MPLLDYIAVAEWAKRTPKVYNSGDDGTVFLKFKRRYSLLLRWRAPNGMEYTLFESRCSGYIPPKYVNDREEINYRLMLFDRWCESGPDIPEITRWLREVSCP
jgi:hypothetical protein